MRWPRDIGDVRGNGVHQARWSCAAATNRPPHPHPFPPPPIPPHPIPHPHPPPCPAPSQPIPPHPSHPPTLSTKVRIPFISSSIDSSPSVIRFLAGILGCTCNNSERKNREPYTRGAAKTNNAIARHERTTRHTTRIRGSPNTAQRTQQHLVCQITKLKNRSTWDVR